MELNAGKQLNLMVCVSQICDTNDILSINIGTTYDMESLDLGRIDVTLAV